VPAWLQRNLLETSLLPRLLQVGKETEYYWISFLLYDLYAAGQPLTLASQLMPLESSWSGRKNVHLRNSVSLMVTV